ncbi:TLC domain-containing protein [Polychytrium aggregatum]|uniref:TLC domain-containing protein n=1 Tax=Polychytrium aggregatum TaxID=110093 RepID=UPI0022FE0031|nr:TLC domain-containing protein [Polychytrium aggregatum]KAI9202833.1 TLC domain-containing protein [Polychytrium aggregatum]
MSALSWTQIYHTPLFPAFFEALGLPKASEHVATFLTTTVVCHLIYLSAFPLSFHFSSAYRTLRGYKRKDWCIHWVTLSFSSTIVCLALPMLFDPALQQDRVFANSWYSGTVLAIACGYFLWDSLIILANIQNAGGAMLVHGVACLLAYGASFRPVLNFYGGVFLMFELSTPFLNVHWFCDKVGLTGSRLQWINGIVLLAVFFFARIVFGLSMSYLFWGDIIVHWSQVPIFIAGLYCIANVVLNSLNLFWFYKMISSVRKRFNKKEE